MNIKRAILPVVFSLVAVLLVRLAINLKKEFTVRTSANASPADVTFLQLPSTATQIGFWQNVNGRFAEFTVTEREFRQLFTNFTFSEISDPTEVTPMKFGDPNMAPHISMIEPVSVTNGLRYSERRRNGGGYKVIFDRAQSRAYYHSANR